MLRFTNTWTELLILLFSTFHTRKIGLNICIKQSNFGSNYDIFNPPNWVQLHEVPICLFDAPTDTLECCTIHSNYVAKTCKRFNLFHLLLFIVNSRSILVLLSFP